MAVQTTLLLVSAISSGTHAHTYTGIYKHENNEHVFVSRFVRQRSSRGNVRPDFVRTTVGGGRVPRTPENQNSDTGWRGEAKEEEEIGTTNERRSKRVGFACVTTCDLFCLTISKKNV